MKLKLKLPKLISIFIVLAACGEIVQYDTAVVIIDKSYFLKWQDTLLTFSFEEYDITLPTQVQRATSLKVARQNIHKNLNDSVLIQKISKVNIVNDLFLYNKNLTLKESILNYCTNNINITETKYFENSVEVYGALKTDSILIIITNYYD